MNTSAKTEISVSKLSPATANFSILAVDDDSQFLELIKYKFKNRSIDLHFATDGLEALDILEKEKVDLVITDLTMPNMDGLELISKINSRYPDAKVIILSAHDDMENIRKAMNLGAFDFLIKPCRLKDLDSTVSKAIREIEVIRSYKSSIQSLHEKILDMVPDLIVVFNPDLSIVEECISKTAQELFGESLKKTILDVLQISEMERGIKEVFIQRALKKFIDVNVFKEMMSLVCSQLNINGSIYKISFFPQMAGNEVNSIFMLGQDITEEKKAQERNEQSSMYIDILRDSDDFFSLAETLDDIFSDVGNSVQKLGAEGFNKDLLFDIFRGVHTIKGNFGMFKMQQLVGEAHLIEEKIEEIMGKGVLPDKFEAELNLSIKKMKTNYHKVITELDTLVGIENKQMLKISDQEINQMFRYLKNGDSTKASDIIANLSLPLLSLYLKNKIRHLTTNISEVVQKNILLHFELTVDLRIPEKIAHLLNFVLPHLIGNAIDHGIEDQETRLENGKSPNGNIYIHTDKNTLGFILTIRDDGCGIDKDKVLKIALEKDIINKDLLASLTESEIYQLLLHPGFSTKSDVTQISGRGIGMDVVDKKIVEVGGTLEIFSEPGKYTEFCIHLPVPEKLLL